MTRPFTLIRLVFREFTLEGFNIREKWDDLNKYSREFRKHKDLMKDEGFAKEVQDFIEGSSFKIVQNLEAKGDLAEAGKQYRVSEFVGLSHLDSRNNTRFTQTDCANRRSNFPLEAYMSVALNHWQANHWLDSTNNWHERWRGSICLAIEEPEKSVEEIENWADHPFMSQILIKAEPRPSWGNPKYDPIWAAATKHDEPEGHVTLQRHGRACPGNPRLIFLQSKTWMPGTRACP